MQGKSVGRKKSNWQYKKWAPIILMGLPGLIYLIINNYVPLYGLVIAFKNYNYSLGITGSEWCGFKNFEYLFKTDAAWIITRNTLAYNVAFIILKIILGIAVAIFLNEVRTKRSKKFYQTVILLPYLMSMVVVSYLAYAFLGDRTGLINNIGPLSLPSFTYGGRWDMEVFYSWLPLLGLMIHITRLQSWTEPPNGSRFVMLPCPY